MTQVLQNTMIPYFITYIKKEDRMKAALTIVEFLRDHMVPKLFARDPTNCAWPTKRKTWCITPKQS